MLSYYIEDVWKAEVQFNPPRSYEFAILLSMGMIHLTGGSNQSGHGSGCKTTKSYFSVILTLTTSTYPTLWKCRVIFPKLIEHVMNEQICPTWVGIYWTPQLNMLITVASHVSWYGLRWIPSFRRNGTQTRPLSLPSWISPEPSMFWTLFLMIETPLYKVLTQLTHLLGWYKL